RQLEEMEFGSQFAPHEAVHLALNDELTGLPNRRAFDKALEKACVRGGAALCLMDLDRFKTVNDALGHVVGDRLLRAVAKKLVTHTRGRDFVCRLAGDEFAVILNDVQDERAASDALDRLLSSFQSRLDLGDVDLSVSLSGGIAMIAAGEDMDQAYRNADVAMHEAKKARKGGLAVHAAEGASLDEHDDLVLVKGLLTGADVPLRFDPAVDAHGAIIAQYVTVGAHGRSIDDVFATAEKFGLGSEFVAAMLKEVCEAAARRLSTPAVHIRLPGAAFGSELLTAQLVAALERSGLPAETLFLEVPQDVCRRESAEVLLAIRHLGVGLILGDWELGFGVVDLLAEGLFSAVKLGGPAVEAASRDEDSAVLVRAAVTLIAKRCAAVLASGVNSPLDATALFASGVSAIHGKAAVPRETRSTTSVSAFTSAA
ncbi:MAG: diguanylate cyclase, partial [Pseudomonadota bacterium]